MAEQPELVYLGGRAFIRCAGCGHIYEPGGREAE